MYQHHATAACSRRDLASNLGKTAFVLSKITSVRVGSGLFEQAETLKGVGFSTVLAVLGKFVAFSMAYIVTLRISKCMIFQEDSAKLPRQC